MGKESLSFENPGMKFVSAGDSERNRARMHYFPPQSEMTHSGYESVVRQVASSVDPKRIIIRNEDQYRFVDPVELRGILDKSPWERKVEFSVLAAEIYSAEEVIIESVNPETINIVNLPQAVFEPLEVAA